MKRPTQPTVGQRIAVTTRHRNLKIDDPAEWDEVTHTGEVLKPEYWYNPTQFGLSVQPADDIRIPFRVIDMENVVSVDLLPESTETHGVGHKPTAFTMLRGTQPMSRNLKTMSWNDRLALLAHYKPSDASACAALGVTGDELTTAREMQAAGTFQPTADLDVSAYSDVFPSDAVDSGPTDSIKAPEREVTATSITAEKPVTATKTVKAPKKRGRKGSNIVQAFDAIPTDPTPAEDFAKTHAVSIAVLRQGKRFDPLRDTKGTVRVKKDKEKGVLMIWREKPADPTS